MGEPISDLPARRREVWDISGVKKQVDLKYGKRWLYPIDSSDHGILLARILECVAISSSRESSQPRHWIHVSLCLLHWQGRSSYEIQEVWYWFFTLVTRWNFNARYENIIFILIHNTISLNFQKMKHKIWGFI